MPAENAPTTTGATTEPGIRPDIRPGISETTTAGSGSALAELGMATAEYAIATLAACGFAGLLLTILKSGQVKDLLFGIVRRALSI